MKKGLVLTVMFGVALALGLALVGCGGGGGNINKVKNGVFSNYDASITVGKALENNSTMKGGKWAAVKMEGRDYVTYTVKFTPSQVKAFTSEDKPNLENTRQFLERLRTWNYLSESRFFELDSVTTLTLEQIKELPGIFATAINNRNQTEDIDPLFTIDGFEIVLSFVMNQDGRTFNTNMIEFNTDVTLKCLNNIKARCAVGQLKDQDGVLNYVYRKFTPSMF